MDRILGLRWELMEVAVRTVHMPTLSDADVRRILQFVVRIAEAVELAFEDICALLVEVTVVVADAKSGGRRQAELLGRVLLLGRGQASLEGLPIGLRLRTLGACYFQEFGAILRRATALDRLDGIWRLIDPERGQVFHAVDDSAFEISHLLSRFDSPLEAAAREIAGRRVREILRGLLELRAFKVQLLNHSLHPRRGVRTVN